jgi:hypothetical protein
MTKHFYSICSAHQVTDENCPLCKIGFQAEDEKIMKEESVDEDR